MRGQRLVAETSLDLEWAHVVAPGATIDLLIAAQASPKDVYGAWSYALAHSLGNQISDGSGRRWLREQWMQQHNRAGIGSCHSVRGVNVQGILNTAASQHVTVLGSAGDGRASRNGYVAGAAGPDGLQGGPHGGRNVVVSGLDRRVSERNRVVRHRRRLYDPYPYLHEMLSLRTGWFGPTVALPRMGSERTGHEGGLECET